MMINYLKKINKSHTLIETSYKLQWKPKNTTEEEEQ